MKAFNYEKLNTENTVPHEMGIRKYLKNCSITQLVDIQISAVNAKQLSKFFENFVGRRLPSPLFFAKWKGIRYFDICHHNLEQ